MALAMVRQGAMISLTALDGLIGCWMNDNELSAASLLKLTDSAFLEKQDSLLEMLKERYPER